MIEVTPRVPTLATIQRKARRTRALARGCPYRNGWRLVIDTDEDTLRELRAEATKRGLSVAATVRLMVEWGLEVAQKERE